MSEDEKEKYVKRHEGMNCCKECKRSCGWMIATAVLAVLLTVSVCFNVYFLVSRGGDIRRYNQDMQMMRPGQNDQRSGNNGMYKNQGGNPRSDAPSDTKDKNNEQKDTNNESGNKN
ncbi:MAG: hypothetical protein K5837_04115 [Candidatus Saccharibacteria bacterium]|nr:hypothetical protein [Candidatus Saccharibacteria bacterium]